MKVIKYPQKNEWSKILARPAFDTSSLNATVSAILAEIKSGGDNAVIGYEEKFDKVRL